jgi:hypothetical protein
VRQDYAVVVSEFVTSKSEHTIQLYMSGTCGDDPRDPSILGVDAHHGVSTPDWLLSKPSTSFPQRRVLAIERYDGPLNKHFALHLIMSLPSVF